MRLRTRFRRGVLPMFRADSFAHRVWHDVRRLFGEQSGENRVASRSQWRRTWVMAKVTRYSQERGVDVEKAVAEKTVGTLDLRWSVHVTQPGNALAGCSNRPSSKATASEGPRRYKPHFVWAVRPLHGSWRTEKPLQCFRHPRGSLRYIEGLNDARTLLAVFFSILLGFGRRG